MGSTGDKAMGGSRIFSRPAARGPARWVALASCAVVLTMASGRASWQAARETAAAQPSGGAIPDLAGTWDGGTRARPANSASVPWGRANFPELNDRALAYVKVFDEALSPKYDCQPSTPPALQYDPYMMEIVQWPDRVLFRYEKDDQLRTVWLDGRKASVHDFGIQGFSVGRYESNALLVETTHFVFDITGFDDYNGIPSSQQKRVLERYWLEGSELRATVTVEDPLFLRKPASYTTRWLPAPKGYRLAPFDCDQESARASIKFLPPKYK
jgi:hypothetical protein